MVERTAAARNLAELNENQAHGQRVLHRRVRRRVEPLMAYGLFVAIAVGLVLLYVAQYAYVAQLNLRLAQCEKRLAEIETLNEQLETEAAELKSLQRVEQEAVQRLGMQKPAAVRTVKAAVSPSTETTAAATAATEPVASSANKPSRRLSFFNWTRNLKKAWAKGVGENH